MYWFGPALVHCVDLHAARHPLVVLHLVERRASVHGAKDAVDVLERVTRVLVHEVLFDACLQRRRDAPEDRAEEPLLVEVGLARDELRGIAAVEDEDEVRQRSDVRELRGQRRLLVGDDGHKEVGNLGEDANLLVRVGEELLLLAEVVRPHGSHARDGAEEEHHRCNALRVGEASREHAVDVCGRRQVGSFDERPPEAAHEGMLRDGHPHHALGALAHPLGDVQPLAASSEATEEWSGGDAQVEEHERGETVEQRVLLGHLLGEEELVRELHEAACTVRLQRDQRASRSLSPFIEDVDARHHLEHHLRALGGVLAQAPGGRGDNDRLVPVLRVGGDRDVRDLGPVVDHTVVERGADGLRIGPGLDVRVNRVHAVPADASDAPVALIQPHAPGAFDVVHEDVVQAEGLGGRPARDVQGDVPRQGGALGDGPGRWPALRRVALRVDQPRSAHPQGQDCVVPVLLVVARGLVQVGSSFLEHLDQPADSPPLVLHAREEDVHARKLLLREEHSHALDFIQLGHQRGHLAVVAESRVTCCLASRSRRVHLVSQLRA
eukprot:scaffold29592_cov64-Phaeocystis_antarctica.AAC.3